MDASEPADMSALRSDAGPEMSVRADSAISSDLATIPDATLCNTADAGPRFFGYVRVSFANFKYSNGDLYHKYSVRPEFYDGSTQKSAGTLTIFAGGEKLTMMPNPDGSYPYYVQTKTSLEGGDVLTVVAAGDALPPMNGAVIVPTPLRFTTPPPGPGVLAVPLKSDFTTAWTGSSSGRIELFLATTKTTVTHLDVAPSAGHDVMTVAEMSKLSPGDGVWSVDQYSVGGGTGCNWTLGILVTTNSVMADDTQAGRTVKFQ